MPQALSLGVDYNLFWSLNPKKLTPFVKAKEEEIKLHSIMSNHEAWLNGVYVRLAVASVLSKSAKYPKQPFDNSGERNGQNSTDKKFKTEFEVWAKQFNKNMKK